MSKKIFTYEEAAALLPVVQRLTGDAVSEIEALEFEETPSADYQRIVEQWASAIMSMGIEVKGLWLIDFDSGSGYYCWRHPEPSLQHFHGYEEGFPGRVKLQ